MSLLTINLNAIVSNWRLLNRAVSSSVAAVIKADAYGLGAEEVGSTLYAEGCREFFFATAAEAINSRRFVPLDANCYVLQGVLDGDESLFVEHKLIPVLSSLKAIMSWAEWTNNNSPFLPCVIKIDTGMTRLGLSEAELTEFSVASKLLSVVNPVLFMSHLACADEPDHPLNKDQLEIFNTSAAIVKKLFPNIKCSLANSAGVFLGKAFHQDMVRTGAALYGVHPTKAMDSGLSAVVNLSLSIIQLRKIKESVDVGYGAEYRAVEGQILAVADGGYADGLHRVLAKSGIGFCLGVEVPVVGRISMDTVIFDVTHVPGILNWLDMASFPFAIEVINDASSVSWLSQKNMSLGYEILTCLSQGRYARRYLLEGEERFV